MQHLYISRIFDINSQAETINYFTTEQYAENMFASLCSSIQNKLKLDIVPGDLQDSAFGQNILRKILAKNNTRIECCLYKATFQEYELIQSLNNISNQEAK